MMVPLGLTFIIHLSIIIGVYLGKVAFLTVKRVDQSLRIAIQTVQVSFVHLR
jgi:hypothetical protein